MEAGYCPYPHQIEIYITGDKDNSNISVTEVTKAEYFSNEDIPIQKGLVDSRLGAITNKYFCHTCKNNHNTCPGHFGHYSLNTPAMQPIVQDDIIKWLRVCCYKCGSLLVNDTSKLKEHPALKRLQAVASNISASKSNSSTGRACPVCKTVQPKYRINSDNIFYIDAIRSDSDIQVLKMEDIKRILEKISDETCKLMGRSLKSHPRKYYFTKMLIPPIMIRPIQKSSLATKSHKSAPIMDFIKQIIRKNVNLANDSNKTDSELLINKLIYDMIKGGSIKKKEQRTHNIIGGPLQSAILKSFTGKKGNIRSQLMGHRGVNTSRITISGNAALRLWQLKVPTYVANILQIPVTVRGYNKTMISSYLAKGQCSRIKKYNNSQFTLINSINKNNIILEYGDVIYRNVMDGDTVLFSRQPSLVGSSKCAHLAKVATTDYDNTFQFNVAVCKNYNADFDGDQMNARTITLLRSIAEAKYLTAIPKWLLTNQNSSIINGQVQDAIVGSALLTRMDVVIDKIHCMDIFSKTGITDVEFTQDTYTGREIVSLLLKRTPISYKGTPTFYKSGLTDVIDYKKEDISIVIDKGELKSGILDKNSIGNSHGSIFHLIAITRGSEVALEVIYQYQQIIMRYLYMRGFTMSLSDLIVEKETRKVINESIDYKVNRSVLYANKFINGQIYAPMGVSLDDYYEEQQLKILSNNTNILKPLVKSIDKKFNGVFHMTTFESRGDINHMIEMLGSKGSVTMEGRRMQKLFSHERTSSYHPRFAMDPESRGFVRNSLVEGFSPSTMGFGGQSGRQQLVQKSQSTALSGATLRKHVKNMENSIVTNLLHIQKSFMKIQYLYGENGFDPKYFIDQKLDTVFMSNKQIDEKYSFKTSDSKKQKVYDKFVSVMKEDRLIYRKAMKNLSFNGLQYKGFSDKCKCLLYLQDMIDDYFVDDKVSDDMLFENVVALEKFIEELPYCYTNNNRRAKKEFIPEYFKTAMFITQMQVRIKFNIKALQNIKTEKLLHVFELIHQALAGKLIASGSCVGIQAAQALGQPLVQSMLDAVHGKSSGARAGLERIKEILGAKYASNLTNGITFNLKKEFVQSEDKAKSVVDDIKGVKIEDLYSSWQIFLEPFSNPKHPDYRHEGDMIKKFVKENLNKDDTKDISDWVIRLTLNDKYLIYKSISIELVMEKIYKEFNNILIIYFSVTDTDPVLRICFSDTYRAKVSMEEYVYKIFLPKLLNLTVRGVTDIIDASTIPYSTVEEVEDQGLKSSTEYIVRTTGMNINSLVSMTHPQIDYDSIQITSVMSTLEMFGIEAARIRVIEQLMAKMEGKFPSYHHLSIYADIVIWSGTVKSIERGMFTEKNKTLSLASGYAAGKVLIDAALQGVKESTEGVSASIMLGCIPRVGTNYNNCLVDIDFVKSKKKSTLDIIEQYM